MSANEDQQVWIYSILDVCLFLNGNLFMISLCARSRGNA